MSPVNKTRSQVLCHCLNVTEGELLDMAEHCPLRSVIDVVRATGAGDGCMACHRRLQEFVETVER